MIEPKEAYRIIKNKFPHAETETINDWPTFYSFGLTADGDTSDEQYKIDKKSGEISKMSYSEYLEEIKKYQMMRKIFRIRSKI